MPHVLIAAKAMSVKQDWCMLIRVHQLLNIVALDGIHFYNISREEFRLSAAKIQLLARVEIRVPV